MRTILAATLAACAFSAPALAQSACGNYEQIVEAVSRKWGEIETVNAVDGRGSMLVIFANPDTGTFTVMMVAAEQPEIACVVATGTGFTLIPPPVPGEPS